jgi:hypothetical protein
LEYKQNKCQKETPKNRDHQKKFIELFVKAMAKNPRQPLNFRQIAQSSVHGERGQRPYQRLFSG